MKNLTISLFYICLAFSFLACFDYEVQFEGSYEDDASDDQAISLDKEVVFVAGGKVYFGECFFGRIRSD